MPITFARQWLGYVAVRLAFCALGAIDPRTCQTIARVVAWVAYDLLRIRRRVTDDNLRHAFPALPAAQRRGLARTMWEHLILLVVEGVQIPRKIHDTNWRDHVELVDSRQLADALLTRRPVMMISAHFGNFELAGYMLGVLGFQTYAVARTLDNRLLNEYVVRTRSRTGQHIVPKKGGYDHIVEVLERGGTLSLLADQYAGTKGCWVEFFGRPASAHKAIALLALSHDALVAVGSARRLKRPLTFQMNLQAIVDPSEPGSSLGGVRELTAWYTNCLERMIRVAPEQYWWLHRRWKDYRPASPRARKAA